MQNLPLNKEADQLTKHLKDLQSRTDNKIKELQTKLYIKKSIAEILQTTNTNFIYYSYSNTIVFNWLDNSEKFTTVQMMDFISKFDNKTNAEITTKANLK